MAKAHRNVVDVVAALDRSAQEALARGAFDEALARCDEALTRAEAVRDPRFAAVVVARRGAVHDEAGAPQEALGDLLEALDRLRGAGIVGRFEGVPTAKHYDPAATFGLQVGAGVAPLDVDLRRAVADRSLVPRLFLHVGNQYLLQPQEGHAVECYGAALRRKETARDPLLRAHLLTQRVIAHGGDRLDEATDFFNPASELEEALALLARFAPSERRNALLARAWVERLRGDDATAEATLREALPCFVDARDARGHARAAADLGNLLLRAGRREEGVSLLRGAVVEAAAHRVPVTAAYASWSLGRALREAGDADGAVAALEASLTAVESHRARLGTDPGKVRFLGSVAAVLEARVEALLDVAAGAPERLREALDASERVRARALLDMIEGRWRKAPRPSGAPPPPPESRRWTRLVFHALPSRTAVFVVARDGAVHGHVPSVGEDAVGSLVAAARAGLGAGRGGRGLTLRDASPVTFGAPPPTDAGRAALRAIAEALLHPLEPLLTPGETVVVEPFGALWLLPFAALPCADGVPFGARFPLLHAPSAAVLDELLAEPAGADTSHLRALLVGNPAFPERLTEGGRTIELAPLPGAEREVDAIAALFPGRCVVRKGAAADRATVEQEMGEFGVVHLATHGLAETREPLRSWVALAPPAGDDASRGLLDAKRLLESVLGRPRPLGDGAGLERWEPVDLVTLSACQTGLGALTDDGVIGLGRAFLAAGARAVLMSLWAVDDEATLALMASFYREYMACGDKAVALHRAAGALRASAAGDDPARWAPFIVVGAPDCALPRDVPEGSSPRQPPTLDTARGA
ncbi:MAG: CHAT domain-containing tetratricopeptide repeat protein [Polyangiales bacterium]